MDANADKKKYGVYMNSMLSKKIVLKITEVGKNVKENLKRKIIHSIEGKCIMEGFVKPNTIDIISYSAGLIKDDHIEFQIVYKCLICNPIKDFEVECFVNNVTKAGIHAVVKDNEDNIPITVFVARDHHITNPAFESVEEKNTILVKIIGTRFELNDTTITAIASLLDKKRFINNEADATRQKNVAKHNEEDDKIYEAKIRQFEQDALEAEEAIRQKEAIRLHYEEEDKKNIILPHEAVVYNEEEIARVKPRKIIIKK